MKMFGVSIPFTEPKIPRISIPTSPDGAAITTQTTTGETPQMGIGFTSIKHFFASAIHDVTLGLQFLQKHGSQIQAGEAKVIDLAAAGAMTLEPQFAREISFVQRGIEQIGGKVFEAIDGAKGPVTVTLVQSEVQEFQQILASFRALHPTGAVVPAGLPNSTTVLPA